MNRRMLSIELMRKLQPLIRENAVNAATVHSIITEYVRGNSEPLNELINSTTIPVCFLNYIKEEVEPLISKEEGK